MPRFHALSLTNSQALAKFAGIIYVVEMMLGDTSLAKPALGQLQSAFGRFAANKQKFPLVHESECDANQTLDTGAY